MTDQIFAKAHETYKVSVNGQSVEYVYIPFDRSRIGIRLDGDLRWFNIRSTKQNTVYCTKTGITMLNGESYELFHWVQQNDAIALWLAQESHLKTRPTKNPLCAGYIERNPDVA